MLDMNLNSTFHMLRAVLPQMRQRRSGRIIAIGSRAAESPGAEVGAYSASKAALVSLIRTVALENKDLGITANVILPGTMDTPANRKAMPGADTSQWVQPGVGREPDRLARRATPERTSRARRFPSMVGLCERARNPFVTLPTAQFLLHFHTREISCM